MSLFTELTLSEQASLSGSVIVIGGDGGGNQSANGGNGGNGAIAAIAEIVKKVCKKSAWRKC